MKKLITIILLALLLVSPVHAFGPAIQAVLSTGGAAACDDTTGMLVYEDAELFDVTDCGNGGTDVGDNSITWTCVKPTGATINLADTTATNLRGAKWIRITGGDSVLASVSPSVFTASGELWFHLLYKPVSDLSNRLFLTLWHDSGSGTLCEYGLRSTGQLSAQALSGTAVYTTQATAMVAGSVYHVWGYFNKGTSSNDMKCHVNFTPLTTYTTSLGSASDAKSENGTHAATDAQDFMISSATGNMVDSTDQIRIKASAISSVCP